MSVETTTSGDVEPTVDHIDELTRMFRCFDAFRGAKESPQEWADFEVTMVAIMTSAMQRIDNSDYEIVAITTRGDTEADLGRAAHILLRVSEN